ncbi:hypothetical protein [Sulfurimonas sp.]|uniref:hypothetical protein n=1 Tax=Sulfurimonas sp. TaxID=2022749 RepID=UPI0025EFF87B|nr:hypothetical protein [Sulfurimonas sp.]MDD5156649.1 hypothetical protein [Sulfurimonas sp.]
MPTILIQTDTTVGFLSQSSQKLYEIKSRSNTKPFIKVYSSFKSFVETGNRVPVSKRRAIRYAKKTTFIVKNRAFRISALKQSSQIVRKLSWCYSTSANKSSESFSRDFCETKSDIIIEDINGLCERESSKLIKINNIKARKTR